MILTVFTVIYVIIMVVFFILLVTEIPKELEKADTKYSPVLASIVILLASVFWPLVLFYSFL